MLNLKTQFEWEAYHVEPLGSAEICSVFSLASQRGLGTLSWSKKLLDLIKKIISKGKILSRYCSLNRKKQRRNTKHFWL